MMLRRLLAPVLLLVSMSACAQPTVPAPAAKPAARPAAAPAFVPQLGHDYQLLATPQPTCVVPFHTTWVKWPVSIEKSPWAKS